MSKVRIINNKARLFAWVRQGWIIEVEKDQLDYYVLHWFSPIEEFVEKKNIVIKEPARTKKELLEILDHNGIEYNKKATVLELEELVLKFEAEKKVETETPSWETQDIEAIKKILVDEAVISAEDLVGKTDADILQIATDNWLI